MSSKDKPFSERYGYTKPKLSQIEGMDNDLRVGLWNAFHASFILPKSSLNSGPIFSNFYNREDLYSFIFTDFLKNARDEYDYRQFIKEIKNVFMSEEWHRVFDLVVFTIEYSVHLDFSKFSKQCNYALKKENSAYRIIGKHVAPITLELERESVETAQQIPFGSAKSHLEKALALFSDRENPDYENSIKESISAVESIAKEITGKEKSLNALTQSLKLHPNLANGLNELYNWTSKDGPRHGTSRKPLSVNQNTARFMLVTCSAFVNYITVTNPKGSAT